MIIYIVVCCCRNYTCALIICPNFAFCCTCVSLGCDVTDLSEDAKEDLEGLDASATYVASLLSAEPPDSKFSLILEMC